MGRGASTPASDVLQQSDVARGVRFNDTNQRGDVGVARGERAVQLAVVAFQRIVGTVHNRALNDKDVPQARWVHLQPHLAKVRPEIVPFGLRARPTLHT